MLPNPPKCHIMQKHVFAKMSITTWKSFGKPPKMLPLLLHKAKKVIFGGVGASTGLSTQDDFTIQKGR
jgi:hypothetical protein